MNKYLLWSEGIAKCTCKISTRPPRVTPGKLRFALAMMTDLLRVPPSLSQPCRTTRGKKGYKPVRQEGPPLHGEERVCE